MNKVSKATGTEYWTKSFKIKASQACKLYLDTDTKFEVAGDNNTMNKTLRTKFISMVFIKRTELSAYGECGYRYILRGKT